MAKYGQVNNPQGKNQYTGGSGQSKPAMSGALPKESFKSAFRRNLDAKEKVFEWNGKMYTTELAPPRKTVPAVPGRPRGESVGEPARPAPMFARDMDFDRNVAAAAIRNREAAAEIKRESRGKMQGATSRWLSGG